MTAIHGYREVHTKSFLEKTKNALNVNRRAMTGFLETTMDTDKNIRKTHDNAVYEALRKQNLNEIELYFKKGNYTKLSPKEQYIAFSRIFSKYNKDKLRNRLQDYYSTHQRLDSLREFLHETGEEYAFIKVDDYKLVGSLIN